jgi:nucleoside-specific outer membrane channel protein Tsx
MLTHRAIIIFTCLTGCTAVPMALASEGSALLWHNNSITYLTGSKYLVDPDAQQTLTLEHASGWAAGDVFAFVDFTHFNGNKGNSVYGEFSPRLSYSKLSGNSLNAGPLKDILLSSTLEFGKGKVETLLLGIGMDFEIPGTNFFQLNLLRRFPLHSPRSETYQLTPVWSVPLGSKWTFDGFIDWQLNSDGGRASNWHFNPQLKYDIGQRFGLAKQQLLIGVEYSLWHNKYGIRDTPGFRTDQDAASFIVKSHF